MTDSGSTPEPDNPSHGRDASTQDAPIEGTVLSNSTIGSFGNDRTELDESWRPPTFRSISSKAWETLNDKMADRHFSDGEVIIRQGDIADDLLLIQDGLAQVTAVDATGTSRVLGRLGAGEVVGEMALLTDQVRTATVTAVGPVKARTVSAEAFARLADERPDVLQVLTDLMAERLGHLSRDALFGKQFEGFRISELLGRGGMSVVYDARRTEDDQRVALKMMSHRLVHHTRARALFENEARLIAGFDHPNIPRLLSTFAAFRTYFIVMQFIEGEPLSEYARRKGQLPESEVLAILSQVADALTYAHRLDVVHRDIKPSNIMLDHDGHAWLMDFGLAIRAHEAGGKTVIAGTPRYMAPEIMLGQPPTAASDAFSLGLIAYELLTGHPKFPGGSVNEQLRLRSEWNTRCFADLLDEDAPDVHAPELARVMDRCFAADPAERTVHLAELASWAGRNG